MSNIHFSSKTGLWSTPLKFFEEIDREFNFNTDVCATPENAKCPMFFTEKQDGLQMAWLGVCWMNPPYGREISRWMEKAYLSAKSGMATVVCLVPARTDTLWWHGYAMRGEIRFIKGRLKFGDAIKVAPFPSALVIFRAREVD